MGTVTVERGERVGNARETYEDVEADVRIPGAIWRWIPWGLFAGKESESVPTRGGGGGRPKGTSERRSRPLAHHPSAWSIAFGDGLVPQHSTRK